MLNVSREEIDILKNYQKLVLKWNDKINLIAVGTAKKFWLRHIIDCLQLLSFIKDKNIHVVDIGSGAGLPGVILSICGVELVTLIESDIRKSAFLLQAASLSSNKINIHTIRVEDIKIDCDILTARAFADLSTIFDLTKNITVKNKYLLLKGKNYQREVLKAKEKWSFDYKKYNSITSEQSKILEICNLDDKNNFYS